MTLLALLVAFAGFTAGMQAFSVWLNIWKGKSQAALIVAQRERIDELECALEMASALSGARTAVMGHSYNLQVGDTITVQAPGDYVISVTKGPTTLTVGAR
jgi:hypothetical protein